jgi:hypothetical protein
VVEESSLRVVLSIFIETTLLPETIYVLKGDMTAPLNYIDQPDVSVEIISCHDTYDLRCCKVNPFHCQI